MSPSLHKPTVHHIFSNYFFISGNSAIYVDCNGLFFYSSYDSKVTGGRTRSFRIVRFRENRNLTYGAINIAQHSYHVYNSDGILYRFWRNYTELTLRTAAQGSQHTIDYTYDVNKILTARAPRSYFKPPPNLHFAVDG